MQAGTYNDTIDQGTTWAPEMQMLEAGTGDGAVVIDGVSYVPVPLTGYSASGKAAYGSKTETIAITFDADRTTGKFTPSLTSAQTLAMTAGAAYTYDILLWNPNSPESEEYPVRGTLTISKTISRKT